MRRRREAERQPLKAILRMIAVESWWPDFHSDLCFCDLPPLGPSSTAPSSPPNASDHQTVLSPHGAALGDMKASREVSDQWSAFCDRILVSARRSCRIVKPLTGVANDTDRLFQWGAWKAWVPAFMWMWLCHSAHRGDTVLVDVGSDPASWQQLSLVSLQMSKPVSNQWVVFRMCRDTSGPQMPNA